MVQPQLQNEAEPVVKAGENRCTACGSADLRDVFEARRLPVHVGVFFDTAEDARRAPTGDVMLAYCRSCGFVLNRRFDPANVSYKPGYEVALHHSEVFHNFMQGVATRLIERYDARNKTVLEIGCGNAHFLRMLCEQGENQGIGIDPTVAREGTEPAGKGSIRLIRDFFTERYADIEADLICCLSVFEHIPFPHDFLVTLRKMIGNRRPQIYFEIFNALRAFEAEETWSIHYEQCNYFSRDSFVGLFERCGFEVLEAASCYEGDQYLYVEAVPSTSPDPSGQPPEISPGDLPDAVANFSKCHQTRIAAWTERLESFERERRRAVVWGTGGKGISFLNMLATEDVIQYVVDINPDKHGKYVPGSAQQIVPPEFLGEYRPEIVILANRLYETEIRQQVQQLGISCEFLIA